MDNVSVKNCYKCKQTLLDNLNISSNTTNLIIILWNKFQIFLYENLNFIEITKTIVTDFQIISVIQCSKYIACLDTEGNIYIDVLKVKNNAPKLLKSLPKVQHNVLSIINHSTDYVLCLKYETNTFKLCLHRFDSQFPLLQETFLLYDTEWPPELKPNRENIHLISYNLSTSNYQNLKSIFKLPEGASSEYSLVIISCDGKTVYACVYNPKINRDTFIIRLYVCPSIICNFEIADLDNLCVIIALESGTVIKLPLTDNIELQIIHLNTAISKLLCLNDSVVYTDGLTMWKGETIYSSDIKLTKLFITQVKDFIIINDKIICTTFTKLIYVIQIDDENCVKSSTDKYCPAKRVLNDSQCLQSIFEEIERNAAIIKKINEEEHYISILSLANRKDIMDKVINTNVIIYESYENAIQENSHLTLTENVSEYFGQNTMLVLIKMYSDTKHQLFNQILSNLLGDLKIHMMFSSDDGILKTCSVKLGEQLKKINYLIPLESKSNTINVSIKLVTNIPGAYDEKQFVWNALYEKNISLNSEHFIRSDQTNRNVLLFKSPDCISDLILNTVRNQYGDTFSFIENTHSPLLGSEVSFYVKLPKDYKEIFKTDDYCKKLFSMNKAEFLLQNYSGEEFLDSKNSLLFSIGYNKVTMEIFNDGFSNPMLKVFSNNVMIAFDIRNFFGNMLYGESQSHNTGEECIRHSFYAVVENYRKSLKDCILISNIEELEQQIAYFERNIVGSLPL